MDRIARPCKKEVRIRGLGIRNDFRTWFVGHVA